MSLTLVILPTKNEHTTIHGIMEEITALGHEGLHVLVADDDSIDGTWRTYGTRWAADSERHHLLRRCGPTKGRGFALREAYTWALKHDPPYDFVIEMAANHTDDPGHVGAFIEALEAGADVVVGQRKGHSQGMAAWATGAGLSDVESGYRGYRRAVLEAITPKLKSKYHTIKTETLAAAAKRGFKIQGVPVTSRALPESAYAQGGTTSASAAVGLWMRRLTGGV